MKTTTLRKGKAIGAHRGFADTFNWVVRCLKNLKGGQGCNVNWVADDTPVIDVDMYECGNVYNEGGGGETLPRAFDPVYEDGVISACDNCIFAAGRVFINGGTLTISATSSSTGYLVLTLTHPADAQSHWSARSASLGIEQYIPSNETSGSVTKIPLYHITNGVVDIDLRSIPTAVLAQ